MLSYSGSPWGASREAKRNPWVVQGGPRETIGAPGGSHGVQPPPKKGPREAIRTTGGGHRVPREARPVAKSCQKRTKTGLRKAKMARRGHPSVSRVNLTMSKVQNWKMSKKNIVFPLQMAWQTAQNWSILVNFVTFWSILMNFGQFWSILINFDQFWSILINFDQFGSILVNFVQFWSIWPVQGGQNPKALEVPGRPWDPHFGQTCLSEH